MFNSLHFADAAQNIDVLQAEHGHHGVCKFLDTLVYDYLVYSQ